MVLGSEESAKRRLNFAQSFNPIGSFIGIVMCQALIMAKLPKDESGALSISPEEAPTSLNTVIYPYLAVAAILAIVSVKILASKMPKASDDDTMVPLGETAGRLLGNRNYVFSVFAQFCYVGTQISVWTYTDFYIPEQLQVTQEVALQWHTCALILFGCARWVFTAMMSMFRPSTLLTFASLMACMRR